MRNSVLSSYLLISFICIGCTKQTQNEELKHPVSAEEQFEIADQKIGKMLEALDSYDVPMDRKHEILCTEYPKVYKKQYVPALLKVSPDEYSEQALLKDFENVSGSYKKALAVNCG